MAFNNDERERFRPKGLLQALNNINEIIFK